VLENCPQLEDFNLDHSAMGDDVLGGAITWTAACVSLAFATHGRFPWSGIAVALGRCARLQHLSLSGCRLTDLAKLHIAKVISVSSAPSYHCTPPTSTSLFDAATWQLHGAIRDESEWSASLRGDASSPAPPASPKLLLDLSHNTLGNDTADALSDALFHDKWLLGKRIISVHLVWYCCSFTASRLLV
jgi:hypothetical protein